MRSFSNYQTEAIDARQRAAEESQAAAMNKPAAPLSSYRDFEEKLAMLQEFLGANAGEPPDPIKLDRMPEPEKKETKPWVRKASKVAEVVANLATVLGNQREAKKAKNAGISGYSPDYRKLPGTPISQRYRDEDRRQEELTRETGKVNIGIANAEKTANTAQRTAYDSKQQSRMNSLLPSVASALFRKEEGDPELDPRLVQYRDRIAQIQNLPEGQRMPALLAIISDIKPPTSRNPQKSLEQIEAESRARAAGSAAGRGGSEANDAKYVSSRTLYYMSQGYSDESKATEMALRDLDIKHRSEAALAARQSKEDPGRDTSVGGNDADPARLDAVRNWLTHVEYDKSMSREQHRQQFIQDKGYDPLRYVNAAQPE